MLSRTTTPTQAMDAPTIEPDPTRWRAIQAAALAVGRGLSREHGLHQFYSLARVQREISAAAVDGALQAWIYATFVSRADFEAYFAVRETPGTYAQLRTAMSTPKARTAPSVSFCDDGPDDLEELLWWLVQVAADG